MNNPDSPETRLQQPAQAIPPLPPNASADQKDQHWLRYVYQGSTQRQLTVRAVLMGGILGMLMALSNLYTTLKLGWSFGVAITACVLSFVIWRAVVMLSGKAVVRGILGLLLLVVVGGATTAGSLGAMTWNQAGLLGGGAAMFLLLLLFLLRKQRTLMSILENTCMQSTASAAGYSTGATVGTAFGALLLMQAPDARTLASQPWTVLFPFVFLTAALGVFLAIPMKRQMINYEQLKFPSGIAAAETLRSLYSHGKESLRKAYSLIIAMSLGGLVGLLRTYGTLVDQLANAGRPQAWLAKIQAAAHIPEEIVFRSFLAPLSRIQLAGLSFEPSVLLIGAGMIVGLRVSLSMLFGSAFLYYVVAPVLLQQDINSLFVPGYVPSFRISPLSGGAAAGGFAGLVNPVRWALWGGTAIMVFSSLTSVALQWRTLARAFSLFKKSGSASQADAAAGVEVPATWLVAGLIPIGIGLVVVQFLAFHISVPLGVIAVAMSFIVALVCCRATGETDTTPIGAMGKVTQLLYAVLPGARGNSVINLMSAGLTASAGSSAADLLTDLKSGYLLGANPRRQFVAQFAGVFFGTLAVVPAWYMMVPDRRALEAFNPPAANMWKAVADLLTQGIQMLPESARWAIVIGALLGVLLPVLEKLFPKAAPYIPSAMGLGLAWVIPFQNALAFAIGAVITEIWTRAHSKSADTFNVPIASGLVAGESLMAAIIAILCTVAGFLALK